ncbi:hypothetical protein [Pseudovibrio sp. Tun.PSC04-5.I4]|uniref:hypothetical protein n=1 Tax=Pseudovibrio sp. Tun.PSC04-5.I4 TaxID=1798213 RepID=UPI00088462E8|nr:hypothetical protein [Pseudovibrio sp. Tun.PSC04-5.I4]SDR07580.1 hypothetical protein SAMN04515695_2626 [Pseudovibrio sp. Tun.PSC04-5.I4]
MNVKNEKIEVQNETYEVLKQAMIFGQWRKKGDVVEMTMDQARFLLLNETLKLKKAPAKKPVSAKPKAASDAAQDKGA